MPQTTELNPLLNPLFFLPLDLSGGRVYLTCLHHLRLLVNPPLQIVENGAISQVNRFLLKEKSPTEPPKVRERFSSVNTSDVLP